MAKRTQLYQKLPWSGGVNTSVDPGVLNDAELVQADNVIFNIAGSRLKRDGFDFFDTMPSAPDLRSSSGTTRTLTWTTTSIYQSSSAADDLIFVGEPLTIGGVNDYAGSVTVLTKSRVAQVRDVVFPADVAGSLGGKYFIISEPYGGSQRYVWFDVDNGSTDPDVSGMIGVEVDILSNDSASAVASAVQAAVDALSAFSASVVSDTVTITNAAAGIVTNETQPEASLRSYSSFTVTTTGSESITYTGSSSLTEASTAAGAITLTRDYSIIKVDDYWRTDSNNLRAQLLMAVTSKGHILRIDSAGRRAKIEAQGQITSVTTIAASGITSGDYFNLWSGNDATRYYVWINKAGGGGDPTVTGVTGVEVAIGGSDTNTQVATAVASAIDALTDFSASAVGAVVTITNSAGGRSSEAEDDNTGFTITTTEFGATVDTELERVQTKVFNDRWICTFSEVGNFPIMYRPESNAKYQVLPNAPDASIITEYLSRLWVNDKTDVHRMHYSETGSFSTWIGAGDSAAIDISPGDGDPEGIVAAYPFKTAFFVHKKTKTYRIFGDSPENFVVKPVTTGLGAESSYVSPVDNDDVVFVSRKGFHTIVATDSFGDTSNNYLSAKIQPTFEGWNQGRLKDIQSVYVPELNSLAFNITERGQLRGSAIWLYNVLFKAWYRWPGQSAQSINTRLVNDANRIIWGTAAGRVVQGQNGRFLDFGESAITYRVKTGAIYPGNNPQSVKAFKALTFMFKPIGDFSFTAKYKIDNQQLAAITYQFDQNADILGETFILGTSLLGIQGVFQPYTIQIDGLGRGITVELEQTGPNEQVEIYGFVVEYEEEGLRNEVAT